MTSPSFFKSEIRQYILKGFPWSHQARWISGGGISQEASDAIDRLWDDMVFETYRLLEQDHQGTLDAYLAAKERTR